MSGTERFYVRLTSETVAVLNTFVESGDYSSLNEVIMSAINEFITSRLSPEDISRLLQAESERKPIDPKSVMAEDDGVRMEDAIKAAVEKFVREKMEGRK